MPGFSISSVSVLGTSRPWLFEHSGVDNPGAPNTVVAFGSGFNDGSDAGGTSGQNITEKYGRLHASGSPIVTTTGATVLGTARPWVFGGTGVNNAGTPNTVVAFASGFNDGSTAGGTSLQNASYRYGQQHTSPAGETSPTTVAVTPFASIVITYISGTVQTQAGGAGNSTPVGSTGLPSGGPNETDSSGYSYPTNQISGATTALGGLVGCFTDSSGNVLANSLWDWLHSGGNASLGSSITLSVPEGAAFVSMGINDTILRDNTGSFSVSVQQTQNFETAPITVAVVPGDLVSIQWTAGNVQTQIFGAGNSTPTGSTGIPSGGVNETDAAGYNFPSNQVPNCATLAGGLVGCFTDSSGNVIANSPWDWKSRGGTSTINSTIALLAPAGAAFLSMGINDSVLRDNTGSFSLTVTTIDGIFATDIIQGNKDYFVRYPLGIVSPALFMDTTNSFASVIKDNAIFVASFTPLFDTSPNGFRAGYLGQLWPHGAQNFGGSLAGSNGQIFPY